MTRNRLAILEPLLLDNRNETVSYVRSVPGSHDALAAGKKEAQPVAMVHAGSICAWLFAGVDINVKTVL